MVVREDGVVGPAVVGAEEGPAAVRAGVGAAGVEQVAVEEKGVT